MPASEKIEIFRRLNADYSRRVRFAERVATRGSQDEIEEAIGAKQESEQEFDECFVMVRKPSPEFLGG